MKKLSVVLVASLLAVACCTAQELVDEEVTVEVTEPAEALEQGIESTVQDAAEPADEENAETDSGEARQAAPEKDEPDAAPSADDTEPEEPAEEASPEAAEQAPADTGLMTLFRFDESIEPEHIAGFGAPVTFERQTAGFVEGRESAPHAPRFVEGKFGKGILLEEQHMNVLSANQADVEKGVEGFSAQGGSSLSAATDHKWQGSQSLKVITPGNDIEEGVVITAQVERGWYNGLNIVPSVFVASLYARGEGCLQLLLKDADGEQVGDPLFFCLSDEWQRFSCTFRYQFDQVSIGGNHGAEWRKQAPEGMALESELQIVLVTTDKQKAAVNVDGLALERRNPASSARGASISPLTWIPGGMDSAQEMLKISTSNDFFTNWRKTGTISFWFKPGWSPKDGTRETILHLGPAANYMDHISGRIRLSNSDITFVPFDWENRWHHIALTWDTEDNYRLHVDGFEYISGRPFDNKTLFLAFFTGDSTLNGVLDDLALFQTALTQEQVRAMAFDEKPVNP